MSSDNSITIVGGGLAGLTLGIGLRQRGVPVTIWEAGHYPRHRVCGEFISGGGQAVLARLGLTEMLLAAGATYARTVAFYLGHGRSPVRPVNPAALSLSRFDLDALLAARFRALDGDLREGARWQAKQFGEGVVRASGRRVEPAEPGGGWLGLKVHAVSVPLDADLEMHGSRDCYIGVSRLREGTLNICGLFRLDAAQRVPTKALRELLRGPPGTPLHERLAGAAFAEDSFCAVAGFSLRPRRAADRTECCIGDALTMIPPVTGNGMSMALEGAEMAIAPLSAYSQGEFSWLEAQRSVGRTCSRAFAQRLAWARWVQWLMFTPALQGRLGGLVLSSDWLWRLMFSHTR